MELGIETIMFYSFLILFLLCILIVFIIKNKKNVINNYIEPFTIFTVAFSIYSLIGAFDNIYLDKYSFYTKLIFCVAVIIGYIIFSFSYLNNDLSNNININDTTISFKLSDGIIHNGKIAVTDLLMSGLFLVFIFINIDTFFDMIFNFGYGISYIETAIRSERTIISGPLALFNSYFTLFLVGYPSYRMFKTGIVSLFDILIFLVVAVFSITSGYRTTLIYIAFSWLVFFNYKRGFLGIKSLSVLGCVMFFGMILLGNIRSKSNIFDMYYLFLENGISYFKLSSSGEFFNTVNTFFDYIELIGNGSYSFNWGYTWLVDLLLYIPTFLFPDRPLPWPEQYMLDFQPFAPVGTGHGWFILNDGYMSFGIIGIIIEMYLMGYVLSKANMYFMQRLNKPLFMFIYVIFLSFVFMMVRSGFLGSVKNFLLEIIPFVLIIFISNKIRFKK